jgi:uncharacterized membrane protein YhaH (DUF805 family)
MIRLRRTIERARRHRWLGLVVLVLLVFLLALLVFHSAADSAEFAAEFACFAVAMLLVMTFFVTRPRSCLQARRLRSRSPPRLPRVAPLPGRPQAFHVLPLRL